MQCVSEAEFMFHKSNVLKSGQYSTLPVAYGEYQPHLTILKLGDIACQGAFKRLDVFGET